MRDITATFKTEIQKLEDIFPLEMYCLNASLSGFDPLYFVNLNQNVMGFSLNATGDLLATETLYTAMSIKRSTEQTNIQSEIPSVNITVPNIDRSIESIVQNNNYMRGCEGYLITTFATYLPSGATADYIGTSPDRYVASKEKLFIDTVSSDRESLTFTLKSKFDLKNIVIPKRTYMKECYWALSNRFNGVECSPAGTVNIIASTCDGTLTQCKERSNLQRYGGFPSVPTTAIQIM